MGLMSHQYRIHQAADQDDFCRGTQCYMLRIYDQSPYANHLDTAPGGGACHNPLSPVNASKDPITVGQTCVCVCVSQV